jgi:hypothetical protein
MVGEKRSGGRERTPAPSALDQWHAKLTLDVRNVLGHCRLADAEVLRRAGKRTPAGESRKGSQSGFKLHNCSLYHQSVEYILLYLRRRARLLSRSMPDVGGDPRGYLEFTKGDEDKAYINGLRKVYCPRGLTASPRSWPTAVVEVSR